MVPSPASRSRPAMRVITTSEYRFGRHAGQVVTDSVYPYAYWRELLDVFDEVVVLARVRGTRDERGGVAVEGEGVRVVATPDFRGAEGILALPRLVATARRLTRAPGAIILRAPGGLSTALHLALPRGRAYGVEVVGDPRESLSSGGPAMRSLRGLTARLLAHQIRGAAATRYVTEAHLQARYPPTPGTFTVAVSAVELPDALFDEPAPTTRPGPALELAFVASLERPYKGLDVLLEALPRTRAPHRLDVVGDGALRPALEAQARALGLGERVRFLGRLEPGAPVIAFLRAHDALVVPSRTEGLPRVLLEGMATGLPCLATPVGGIPEILPTECLVPVGDSPTLARAIDELAADPPRRVRLAAANRARARDFRRAERDRKLRAFYAAVRDATHAGR